MRRITLMRGTGRIRVIEGASVRLANATTSALKRSVANERSMIWVSIGTGGIYQMFPGFWGFTLPRVGRN